MRILGISDITSSEGNLKRFTQFCSLIYESGAIGSKEIDTLLESKTKLTNRAVRERHVRIMSRLGLLKSKEEEYIVSSEGKALLQLTTDKSNPYEKIFYFRALFSNAFYQLYSLLETINENEGKDKAYIMAKYFEKSLHWPFNPWPRLTIQKGLNQYKQHGRLTRGLENKFECMRLWLEQLGLVSKVSLTSLGKALITCLDPDISELEERIFSIGSIYVNERPDSVPSYLDEKHRPIFMNLFNEAIELFRRKELRIIDLKAIRVYICIKILIDHQIILENKDFDRLISTLADENIIKSFLKDDWGQLAYISVG